MENEIEPYWRQSVLTAYKLAQEENKIEFEIKKNPKATAEYIFPNQREDAFKIMSEFYTNSETRIISVQKKTKVGADGLMIELAYQMCIHSDPIVSINPDNVRIITGMSNTNWERDMIEKSPKCFKDKIFHHGKLSKSDLKNLKNSLIIIDEIDSGSKESQCLDQELKEAGILDITNMLENNIRIVVISATMIKELHSLYKWDKYHKSFIMTIPESYVGHTEMLERGLIKDFYSINSVADADKWIKEDIKQYGDDYRIHIIRTSPKNIKHIQDACIMNRIIFRNHTSGDRMTKEEENEFFNKHLKNHIVLGVKGFFRRANLIPNEWKKKIGATHELCTKIIDMNVQIQGLPGRMTGYWKHILDSGHKTGPHRTSINAIKAYEKKYYNPFGGDIYRCSGFYVNTDNDGNIITKIIPNSMLDPDNIKNLESRPLPYPEPKPKSKPTNYRIYKDEAIIKAVCKELKYTFRKHKEPNSEGFIETSLNIKSKVASLTEAINKVDSGYGGSEDKAKVAYRTYYPCYVDTTDNTTLRYVLIIRPGTDEAKLKEVNEKYPSLPQ